VPAAAGGRERRAPASGARTTPCSTAARSSSRSNGPDDDLEGIVERLPSSASDDFGQPFGKVLEAAEWDFYKIDPLLFSPAEIRS
jgi:hypothetical protein